MKKLSDLLTDVPSTLSADEIIDRLMEDPIINHFMMKNDLRHEAIVFGINHLMSFKESKDLCNACHGLFECKLNYVGMTPRLVMYGGAIALDYGKCRYNNSDDSRSNIDAMYIPKKIFNADLSDFDLIGQARKDVLKYVMEFLRDYSVDHPMKGLYLTGVFGSGKTYILAAIAKELAKKGYRCVFAYYPDLVRELKSSIGSGNLEEKINHLKKVDVLMLDDIGGETNSAFIRDEVLGPILQHRVLDNLPTFFSSNLKMKSLMQSMCLNASDDVDRSKAMRIFERIRELSTEFELTEKPLR